MSSSPTVQRMVMFKHGVAYVERGGPADGPFELSFKREEMNDVLKSLAAWVARGDDARIGAVAFEKPEDPEAALARRKLSLQPHGALQGLIASLRGRRVAVDAGGVRHEGEVVGLEDVPAEHNSWRRSVVLRTASDRVALVELAHVRAVDLLEAPSRADLEFLVDRTRAATSGENRIVRVALTGRAEDVRVSYVIPAPVWRVSYRVAREGAATTLMAWGIVHNPADEDLDDIELTLTTGQPVSFVIDLYNPKEVARVVVEESTRALAAPPTQYERAPMPPPFAPPPAAAPMGMPQGGFGPPPGAPPAPAAPAARSMAQAMEGGRGGQPAAEYADRGELFEYRVTGRVSLKRGGSAMVPLLTAQLDARKERIWRDGSAPSPELVITFKNASGAVLEEGPAVIYDEGVYAGEAMVPYSARGVDVKLAFAKDLGVRCRRNSSTRTVVSGVRLDASALVEERRYEEHHVLRADSDHAEPVDVVFELPKTHGRALDPEAAQPFEETASYRRFRLTVPPRAFATVTVVERWADARHVQYTQLAAQNLAWWLEHRFLDRATHDALAGVVAEWARAAELDAKRARAEREQQEAYEKQAKISQQLGVLKEGGAEGNLRLRYVRELEAEQDRVNQLGATVARLRDEAEQARRAGGERLARLTASAGR